VEDVESQGQLSEHVGSRVMESLLESFIMTLEKRECRLTMHGSMNRFSESLEGCREASENQNAFLVNN